MTKSYLIILFIILNIINLRSQNNVNFSHLSPKTDSGYRMIKNTIQDPLGYVWMSQDKGILKYDGYEYWFESIDAIFNKYELKDAVERIEIDTNGNILVLSRNGLLARREINGNYTQLNNFFSKTNKIVLINKIFTKKNQVWLTDYSGTIYLENKITSKFDSISTIPNINLNKIEIVDLEITKNNDLIISTNIGVLYKYSIAHNILQEIKGPFNKYPGILYITLGKNDDLWIGTEYMGLFQYDFNKSKFTHHSYHLDNVDVLAKDMILALYCDSEGIIWAGSDGEGLYRINPENGEIKLIRHISFDQYSLSSNVIIDINEDSNENLWVITNYGDVNVLPNNENNIFHHKGSTKNISARVLSIFKDSKNNLWIGTDGKGLTRTNLITGSENQYLTIKNTIEGDYIQSIIEDNNGNIWIGSYKNGLWFYNSKTAVISKIPISNSKGIEATDVLTIFNDSKGRIWVGSDIGLFLFNAKKEKIALFYFEEKGLYGELVRSIIEDSENNIWVGTDRGGLFKFNEKESLVNADFQRFPYAKENSNATEDYSITTMSADTKKGIWIVNLQGELFYFNTIDQTFKEYKNYKSFKDATFQTVLMEDDNNLWLSSSHGLWHFNVKDSIVRNFYKTDGFQNDYYIKRSAFKDKYGFFYFGGINGVNGFNPKDLSKTPIISQLHINSIEILNKSASLLIPEQVKNGIEQVKTLDLAHDQSSFSFRFSTIGTILNSNYFYAYRLKGFNDEWKITQNERVATYTNIPPGNYIFEVKAATVSGNWDIPVKAIQIKVHPPIWNHPLVHLLYFIIFFVVIYSIFRWYKLRKNLLLQKFKNNQEKEIYAEKMNFFSKMSHEIQTPLTLILSPIEKMLVNAEENGDLLLTQRLKIISNNAKRLSRIANELTTIRNKEIGQLKLKVSEKDIIKEIKEIAESFTEQARFKKIDFEQNYFNKSYKLWFDLQLVEHIIYNLLSNAFKFTPREGKIKLETKIDAEKNMLMVAIADSGHGISKEEHAKVFKLFYRTNKGKKFKGTGIGLALVKELIDLHKGEIIINSEPKKGTEFIVYIPLDKAKYSKKDIVDYEKEPNIELKTNIKQPLKLAQIENSKYHKQTLLIVEDNFEMQNFLQDIFRNNYKILLADNGAEGLEVAINEHPNIIISDISMPIMNGLEMCENLRNNLETSHIPVILLTAKNTTETKLKGLEYGAIEFIQKPFDIKELQLKTHNILTSHEKVYSNFASQYISTPEQSKSKSKDVLFLEKLIGILNSELDNPEFKLESLSNTLNMSYSAIYRKCQNLTGKTIVDLFRLMRLKKSAIHICKNGYSISEACFAVGFNDTKYFSKCFKIHFKKTPNTFKKEAENSDLDTFLTTYKLNEFDLI